MINSFFFYFFIYSFLYLSSCTFAQKLIAPGIEQTTDYLPQLRNKNVAIFCNQTSVFNNGTHLVDSLISLGIQVIYIFAPEHGFRGNIDAGEEILDNKDPETGIQIISLYGTRKEPSQSVLDDIDIILFDIQDVGVRFYTYISSLEYIIRSCMKYGKPITVLDRPNPNGHYVDGPVLKRKFTSFVGMQPIPVVYGMTIGEYAQLLVGEQWVMPTNAVSSLFKLSVIPCKQYSHTMQYHIPIAPSPNLLSDRAIALYPSLCFFEGTLISLGRGTQHPFEIFGHPLLIDPIYTYKFTPKPNKGNKRPLYQDKICKGLELYSQEMEVINKLNLSWLINAYKRFPDQTSFFIQPQNQSTLFFDKLAGSDELRVQIQAGLSEKQIRAAWQKDINRFLTTRKKYLLYTDF